MDVNAMLYVAGGGEARSGAGCSLLDKDCLAGKFVLIPSERANGVFSTATSVRGG